MQRSNGLQEIIRRRIAPLIVPFRRTPDRDCWYAQHQRTGQVLGPLPPGLVWFETPTWLGRADRLRLARVHDAILEAAFTGFDRLTRVLAGDSQVSDLRRLLVAGGMAMGDVNGYLGDGVGSAAGLHIDSGDGSDGAFSSSGAFTDLSATARDQCTTWSSTDTGTAHSAQGAALDRVRATTSINIAGAVSGSGRGLSGGAGSGDNLNDGFTGSGIGGGDGGNSYSGGWYVGGGGGGGFAAAGSVGGSYGRNDGGAAHPSAVFDALRDNDYASELDAVTGGGGGGGRGNATPGAGGDAGGRILLASAGVTVNANVTLSGSAGGNGTDVSGGGGGGSGGLFLAVCNTYTHTSGTIDVSGGAGGNGSASVPNADGGAGGKGRVEIIYFDSAATPTTSPASTEDAWRIYRSVPVGQNSFL
jgi:hypothetical protein